MDILNKIQNSDYDGVRRDLHELIAGHRLISFINVNDGVRCAGRPRYEDLAQELFLALWAKKRFAHYLESGMTNAGIVAQIRAVEITNLISARIRQSKPEHFRLARRISDLVRSSPRFRNFDDHAALRRRAFGLAGWTAKPTRLVSEMERRVSRLRIRPRDCGGRGRSGSTPLVIGTRDLEKLIISVLTVVDAPCTIENLRDLVLSRLPLCDAQFQPVADYFPGAGNDEDRQIADDRPSAEELLLTRENLCRTGRLAEDFLKDLTGSFRKKIARQTALMLGTLYYCFLDETKRSQLEIAFRLGVSDSLVSSFRKTIAAQLSRTGIGSPDQADKFRAVLTARVETLLAVSPDRPTRRSKQ
jgi:hypothetical protein